MEIQKIMHFLTLKSTESCNFRGVKGTPEQSKTLRIC